MKLIVGLGNPGSQYQNTRHNVGFLFIDFLRDQIEKEKKKRFEEKQMLHVKCYMLNNVTLAKPQTFMNKSGDAVKKLLSHYSLLPTDYSLIVAHDDLDIPLGKFKIQKGTGPRMHNGIDSIEKALDTHDFWRVRIGIDNRKRDGLPAGALAKEGETYVLQNFTQEEQKIVQDVFQQIWERIKNRIFARGDYE